MQLWLAKYLALLKGRVQNQYAGQLLSLLFAAALLSHVLDRQKEKKMHQQLLHDEAKVQSARWKCTVAVEQWRESSHERRVESLGGHGVRALVDCPCDSPLKVAWVA